MKRVLAAVAACLFATVAFAADTVTITVVSDVPGSTGTASKTYTLSQGNMAVFLAWAQNAYQAPPCVPVAPATTCTTTPFTLLQSLAAWADAFAAGTWANVNNYQRGNAAASAAAAVTAIAPQ